MNTLTTTNFSDLVNRLNRDFIGFHTMFDEVSYNTGFPPYNIVQIDENNFVIEMAVAGFDISEIDIVQEGNTLTVSGTKNKQENQPKYIYKGIAERSFSRKFKLADYVTVLEANSENGYLTITLQREIPEKLKPRKIEINQTIK